MGEYSLMLNFSFGYVFYFMMTTISLVGYGASISSTFGKLAIILLLIIIVTTIPEKATEIVALLNSKSKYARDAYISIENVPHIVLIGTISMNSLFNFLGEYFHKDHGDDLKHCVLMIPNRPDPNLEI